VTHAEFLARFAQLRPKIAKRMKELTLPSEQCMLLLNDIWPNQSYLGPKASKAGSGLSNKAFEVGKTKVYFSNGVLESLENIRGQLSPRRLELQTLLQRLGRPRRRLGNFDLLHLLLAAAAAKTVASIPVQRTGNSLVCLDRLRRWRLRGMTHPHRLPR
jgi:hypothetical protein